MRPSRFLAMLLLVGVIACSEPTLSVRERAVIEQTLEGQLQSWARAWNNGDRDSLAILYVQSPDLTVIWVDGRSRRGWDDEQMAQTSLFNSTERVNLVVQNPTVQVLSPEVALTTFNHSIDVVRLGGRREMVRSGAGTIIWVKDGLDAMWRIQTAHLSVTPPAAN